jgi:hypothetical protein
MCLEGILYGMIFCSTTQAVLSFFPGLYSGILVIYLQYAKNNSQFYALCVLYLLSTAIIVLSIPYFIVSNNNHLFVKFVLIGSPEQWR